MPHPVIYAIVDRDDGLFEVVASLKSELTCRRGGFSTLAEADECVEDLKQTMAPLGAPVVRSEQSEY